jgi:riboflavin kinase/FMN adenylyltransferase
MKIICPHTDRTPPAHSAAVAIGNFDGLHLGHQRILSFLAHRAAADALAPLILTFSPHPGKVTGGGKIQLLQTEEQKLDKIERFGGESVYILPFNQELARLTAEDFVRDILIERLNCHVIVVGENFRFGRDRKGDMTELNKLARKYALTVCPVPSLLIEGTPVSSSFIRDLILKGEIAQAARLLGEAYEIRGRVISGRTVGQGLGFPTANLETRNEIVPNGVFVTTAMVSGSIHAAVTNIGTRPTFNRTRICIETHILDFAEEIYGADISLRFLKKLRDERRFESPEALRKQILKDLRAARRYFAHYPLPPLP